MMEIKNLHDPASDSETSAETLSRMAKYVIDAMKYKSDYDISEYTSVERTGLNNFGYALGRIVILCSDIAKKEKINLDFVCAAWQSAFDTKTEINNARQN